MQTKQPKEPSTESRWAAWKDRLGIAGVVIVLLLLFFMMFTDASLNFQCSVTDFITFKCNRFDRTFKKWEPDKKKTPGTSLVPALQYRGGKVVAIEFKAYARG